MNEGVNMLGFERQAYSSRNGRSIEGFSLEDAGGRAHSKRQYLSNYLVPNSICSNCISTPGNGQEGKEGRSRQIPQLTHPHARTPPGRGPCCHLLAGYPQLLF